MNISEFAKLFPEKMREVTHYLEGDGVKSDIGRVASVSYTHLDVYKRQVQTRHPKGDGGKGASK